MKSIELNDSFKLYCFLEPAKAALVIEEFKSQFIDCKAKWMGTSYKITVVTTAFDATRIYNIMEKQVNQ